MRRIILLAIVSLSVAAPFAANAQSLDSFQSQRHYRFLPRFSTLSQSGGFAGVDVDWRVFGEFDFYNPFRLPNVDAAFATFKNVEAWASHPILAIVLDLDDTLNLSGLRGQPVSMGPHLDVFKFQGKTSDGSSVVLHAAQLGRWYYLRGGTEPPPGSADFFEYQIRALARQTPTADFDRNDIVDSADFAKWMLRFGLNPAAGASATLGDADGDRDVDGGDFLAWQAQAGEAPPSLESFDAQVNAAIASVSAAAVVPEPGAGLLMAMGAGLFAARRRG